VKTIFFSLLILGSLQAKTIETDHFEDLLPYAKPKTLVILDVDNTLVTTAQSLGNDVWFRQRLEEYLKKGLSVKEALDKCVMEWEAFQNVTKVELPEHTIPHVIETMQKMHQPLIALSTRSVGLSRATLYQLLSLNIDLRKSPFSHKEHCFMKDEVVAFKNGILLTSGTQKGEALFTLLDHIGFKPEEIVFINDKATNLREVETECEKRGIPFIGLRYSKLDERMKLFNKSIADIQFQHALPLMSDQEALKKLQAA
jgi:hypothetical protein